MGGSAPLSSALAPPRGVLWDVDGTLVDSAEQHYEAWRVTLAECGRSFDRDEFAAGFGQRNDAILRRTLGAQITVQDIQRIGDTKEARYRELVRTRGITTLPGVREWLGRLRADGWRQAIASSGPLLNAHTIITALELEGTFGAVVSADEVPHGKPDPDVFLAAAARLDVAPARCVVVEDAPAGVEAGRRAGMRTLGVLTTHARLDADYTVRSLAELEPKAFDALLGR